jgi:hypothetical protein
VTSQDKAAELLAAVRAVESGERSAASFFTRPEPARAPAAAAAAAAPAGRPRREGPVEVPEEVRGVLAEGGAPAALAPAVVSVLGDAAAEVLRADPWQLLALAEVRPEQADGFARALLGGACGPDDERRAQALAVRLLEDAARSGHTVLTPDGLARGLAGHGVTDPDEAVRTAIDQGTALVFEEALDGLDPREADTVHSEADGEPEPAERPVRLLLGLERYALAEEGLADALARLVGTAEAGAPDAAAWERAAGAASSPSAAELLRTCAGHGVVAHTGGETARAEPAALVAAAAALGLRACAVAHGEDSRQRADALIRRATATGSVPPGEDPGPSAVTLEGLLTGREGPERTADGLFPLDVAVVLDAQQLGAERAAALAESLPDGARLVLSGDPLLLGSAGAGQVFRDVLASRAVPQVVSRTPDPGPVGELVSSVGAGELPAVDAPGREVVIVPVRDAGEAVHRTVQLVTESVPRAFGVTAGQTLVITPGHGGAAGTRVLNAALKSRLNPGPGAFGGFDPGDAVIHSPAPGPAEPGTVAGGGPEGLVLDCGGRTVTVPPARVETTVRHGWAVTGHQAAALHRPTAVVVLPGDATAALTREWIYTAFSRAGTHLSVVHGADRALPRAVAEGTVQERNTRLRTLLVQAVRAVTASAAD